MKVKNKINKNFGVYYKFIGDFSRYKIKCQNIKIGMFFKKLNCRFFIDYCS